jgi:hypothetical protein
VGLRPGDVLVEVAGAKVGQAEGPRTALQARAPGAAVKLVVQRKKRSLEVTATLAATSQPLRLTGGRGFRGGRGRGWDSRVGAYWTKKVYNLAVVCVEYPDVKHNITFHVGYDYL